jgi:hypothetical protein
MITRRRNVKTIAQGYDVRASDGVEPTTRISARHMEIERARIAPDAF